MPAGECTRIKRGTRLQSNVWLVAAIWMGLALVSTGLTFRTISALFGLTNHVITKAQYTTLVTTVIGSAIVPTLIAQRLFQPALPGIERTEEDIEFLTQPS